MISKAHWLVEDYKEIISTKQWREHLLEIGNKIIFKGHLRELVGRRIGPGVYEISKKLPEKPA